MTDRDPEPGAYRPFVAARSPGGRPAVKPRYRVLVHRQYLDAWNGLADRVGMTSAQQFWAHVSSTPGTPPSVGTSTVLRGKHHGPKWAGYSRTIHYEISGAGRIDYQYCNDTTEGDRGDAHSIVKILTIDLGSH
ncbi:hypothetical protein AB0H58_03980 [Nocardia neocaledoniensis]|uniref:hypothetical protein n=1 Tax=Nocardia neocaledoniensis TaxID=236511 RepID=UPI0033CC77F6